MVDPKVTGPPIDVAHAHAPVGGPGLTHRLCGAGQTPGQAEADRQSQQQHAGDERVDGRRQGQPIDGLRNCRREAATGIRRLRRERRRRSGSGNGLHGAATGFPAPSTGKASSVMVTVVQCISSGIDSDATSTMTQDVICTCGFRTRRRFKPIHTTLPRSKERSADSARIASIIFSLASFAFAFATWSASMRNCRWSSIAVSTMPTRTSSTEPLQNQSTMRWTAFAATRPRGSAAW